MHDNWIWEIASKSHLLFLYHELFCIHLKNFFLISSSFAMVFLSFTCYIEPFHLAILKFVLVSVALSFKKFPCILGYQATERLLTLVKYTV